MPLRYVWQITLWRTCQDTNNACIEVGVGQARIWYRSTVHVLTSQTAVVPDFRYCGGVIVFSGLEGEESVVRLALVTETEAQFHPSVLMCSMDDSLD